MRDGRTDGQTDRQTDRQTETHLPGLTQSAHGWVAHAHDDSEEGVEVLILLTAVTERK